MIVFLDETGFSQRPSLRRTWAPRGQTPVTDDHVNWQRLSAIGAIAWRPGHAHTRLFLSLHRGSITQAEICEFLRSLRRHIRGPIIVIWDRLSAHRGQQVREYLAHNRSWLRVAPQRSNPSRLSSRLDRKFCAAHSAST